MPGQWLFDIAGPAEVLFSQITTVGSIHSVCPELAMLTGCCTMFALATGAPFCHLWSVPRCN